MLAALCTVANDNTYPLLLFPPCQRHENIIALQRMGYTLKTAQRAVGDCEDPSNIEEAVQVLSDPSALPWCVAPLLAVVTFALVGCV